MAEKVKVWFDPEGDFLEVRFSDAPGFMRETAHDALMERVDEHGQVVGFSILGVSRFRKESPFEAELPSKTLESFPSLPPCLPLSHLLLAPSSLLFALSSSRLALCSLLC